MPVPCQACKTRPATVHITDISEQGEKQEKHLCEVCAQNSGIVQQPPATDVQEHTPLKDILTGFTTNKESVQQIAALRCPTCGLSFVEFRNSGLLGCPGDYEAFAPALLPLIERAHEGASHHIGKVPHRADTLRARENNLVRLKRELNKAIEEERYEEAAKLRDSIKTLGTE